MGSSVSSRNFGTEQSGIEIGNSRFIPTTAPRKGFPSPCARTLREAWSVLSLPGSLTQHPVGPASSFMLAAVGGAARGEPTCTGPAAVGLQGPRALSANPGLELPDLGGRDARPFQGPHLGKSPAS